MFNDRTIIPTSMKKQVLEVLHSAHQGVYSMGLRAEDSVFWPGLWKDLERVRLACNTCNTTAPSQSNLPPVEPVVPEYPFQHVCIDYLTVGGVNYGVFVDRYTGWPGVIAGTLASDVATFIAKLCEIYGVPETITSDGGPNLTARSVEELMNAYGIYHRITSVANPHANARAELGVKTVKRLLRTNVGAYGTVDTARFTRAILQVRNTPDRDTRISPAEALFGRKLKDFLPCPKRNFIGGMWKDLADKREQALAKRSTKADKTWKEHTRLLKPLVTGDHVFVQNQSGNHKLRWDRSGQVVKVNGFDQYTVKLEGSRQLMIRNRKFLRKFNPYNPPGWT